MAPDVAERAGRAELDGEFAMAMGATRLGATQGEVEHEGNPAFTRHIESAVAREAFSGGWRLSKGRSRKQMDAAVAAAMVAHIAVQERGRAPAAEPRILVLG